MKAIQIRYLCPTNTKGARLKAFTDAGTITVSREYGNEPADQARELAQSYADKYNWGKVCGFGTIPNGDYVATIGV